MNEPWADADLGRLRAGDTVAQEMPRTPVDVREEKSRRARGSWLAALAELVWQRFGRQVK